MITTQDLFEADKKYSALTKGDIFYNLASRLTQKGFEVEGCVLILATWNSGYFRFAMKDFDVYDFGSKLEGLSETFKKLQDECVMAADLDQHRGDILKIFDTLSKIRGVGFTGAPKIMHLKNPKLFIMWDDYIRGGKAKRFYTCLPIFISGSYQFKRYPKDSQGYFTFLKDMQTKFRAITFPRSESPQSKVIDEFNFVNITLEIQSLEKEENKKKRSKATSK